MRLSWTPPHCLKKNGTSATWHWSRISVTHSRSIGRAPGPDSPPTITQSIPQVELGQRAKQGLKRKELRVGMGLPQVVDTET